MPRRQSPWSRKFDYELFIEASQIISRQEGFNPAIPCTRDIHGSLQIYGGIFNVGKGGRWETLFMTCRSPCPKQLTHKDLPALIESFGIVFCCCWSLAICDRGNFLFRFNQIHVTMHSSVIRHSSGTLVAFSHAFRTSRAPHLAARLMAVFARIERHLIVDRSLVEATKYFQSTFHTMCTNKLTVCFSNP